jgi:outer membrane protein insertion porin family
LRRDTRNRLFNPSSGSRNEFSVKYAGIGGDAEFTKVQGSSSWYFPLPWDTSFHVNGTIGEIYADDKSKLPVYEHFYLGGMNTVRGFKSATISPRDPETDEKIGGDKMWYTNVEYSFPLLKDAGVAGAIFWDAGNVYAVEEDWDFATVKQAVGVEFRWLSPMGPLRLSWGYNLDQQDDESQSVWDFTIGGMF